MPSLKGTKTHEALKEAFAGESMANRRYLYFARKAELEGFTEVKELFEATAKGETGHAFGHLDHLADAADPAPAPRRGGAAARGAGRRHPGQPRLRRRRRDLRVHRDVPRLCEDRA